VLLTRWAKSAADVIADSFMATPVAVAGVGDEAFAFLDADDGTFEIAVFVGTTQVVVTLVGNSTDPSDARDKLIALAKKLLS
jgi:hypothetical protein